MGVTNNDKISIIPTLNKLYKLTLYNCNNIEIIPKMPLLMVVIVSKCNLLKKININVNSYSKLHVKHCPNINNCEFYSLSETNNITEFCLSNKIKNWYKRVKLSKILWKYAEIVLIEQMNPHKENNKYLQKYIKENVYDE